MSQCYKEEFPAGGLKAHRVPRRSINLLFRPGAFQVISEWHGPHSIAKAACVPACEWRHVARLRRLGSRPLVYSERTILWSACKKASHIL